MTVEQTRSAYAGVADQYIELLGNVEVNDPALLELIADAFRDVSAPILDAGCGPGHMTAYLRDLGHTATGLDAVEAFVAHARSAHPDIAYAVGDLTRLDQADGSLGGVLAWFSVIHMTDEEVAAALAEFHRVVEPGGVLVVGMFHADARATFPHKVTPAVAWPQGDLEQVLTAAGFEPRAWSISPAGPTSRAHLAVAATRLG